MPAAIPIAGLVISAGSSIYSIASAEKRRKKAQKEIDNYKRQDLTNSYKDVQISTLGADRQREDLARMQATYANLAAMGGMRGIMGLSPQLLQQYREQEAQIAANLDQQEKARQQLIAQGDMQVMGMQEQRENNDLLGLGNAMNVARQERAQGINQLAQTAVSAAALAANSPDTFKFNNSGSNIKPIQTPNAIGKLKITEPIVPKLNIIPTNPFYGAQFYGAQPANTGFTPTNSDILNEQLRLIGVR